MPPSAQVETRSSTSHWGKDKIYAVWCWADGGNYFKSDLNDTPLKAESCALGKSKILLLIIFSLNECY